jgi:hypothetical protein
MVRYFLASQTRVASSTLFRVLVKSDMGWFCKCWIDNSWPKKSYKVQGFHALNSQSLREIGFNPTILVPLAKFTNISKAKATSLEKLASKHYRPKHAVLSQSSILMY